MSEESVEHWSLREPLSATDSGVSDRSEQTAETGVSCRVTGVTEMTRRKQHSPGVKRTVVAMGSGIC